MDWDMDWDPTVLLIDEDPAAIDSIRRVLGDQASRFKLRRVADVPTALARIRGGGIDLVLLNLVAGANPTEIASSVEIAKPVENGGGAANSLAPFRELHEKAPGVPVVILCDSAGEGLARTAVQQGATAYLLREAFDADLLQLLLSAASKPALSSAIPRTLTPPGKGGKIITFMGAKGGVGTTTVALNVAAALAAHRRVILVELHAELGSLPLYFQPHRSMRDIGDLLATAAGRVDEIPFRDFESCLWPVKNVPGLQVLFGSRSPQNSVSLDPGSALAILALASEIADYVIVDLPASLSATNRAVLENSACLTLVVERDPISVQSAKLILNRVDSWKAGRLTIGAVILNRAALVSPMPFAAIDAELRIATLGVIPPAPDLCAAAQHAHSPMVTLDPDSLVSVALRDLGREIENVVPSARLAEQAGTRSFAVSQKMTPAEVR
jgi:MinD-like ATPase involved in chromosome partitioning or flagellar assembly/DNA-binding NarL/FixJ family response regulator